MTVALLLATFVAALLLALASAVQLLYLESLRLRSRDLPSLEFFKNTLEPGIGLKTDDGGLTFSLLKHSMLAIMGVLILADFLNQTLTWAAFFEASITSLILMLVASYGVLQITYRRTKGRWLAPLVPVLRVLGLIIRPASAFLAFFYSLVEMADDKNGTEEQATPAENIDALISAGTEEGLIQ